MDRAQGPHLTPERLQHILQDLPPEQRLAGLTPEQLPDLAARLPPEVLEAAKKRSS